MNEEVEGADGGGPTPAARHPGEGDDDVPPDVREYARFSKIDGATYDRANEFLRERT